MLSRVLLAFAAGFLVYSCTPTVQAPPAVPAPAEVPRSTPVNAPTVPSIRPESRTQTTPGPQSRPVSEPAEILVLGDSQISFGAGGAYTAYFGDLAQKCGVVAPRFARADAAAIGVRSSALHHWTARNESTRGMICDVDPKFGVNAGSYGVTSDNRSYVQIGADPNYPFCTPNRSPLEAVFDTNKFNPDLVVLAFLGNATGRWQSATTARNDWQAAAAQLPAGMPCIVMTTIPSYEKDENDRRARAQANLAAAVQDSGNCAFVPGFTTATRQAIEGNTEYFRADSTGKVTDPNHPTAASAARFIDIQTPALCAALNQVLPN